MSEASRHGQSHGIDSHRTVASCAYGPEELLTLRIVRYFFRSFAQPSSHDWIEAIVLADKSALRNSGQILAMTIDAVQFMRIARASCFHFIDPKCPCCSQNVTPHERLFMACVTSARNGDMEQASRHAFLLCEGNDISAFLSALNRFSTLDALTPAST